MSKKEVFVFFRVLEKISDIAISMMVVSIIVIVLLQVVARYFGWPVAWTEEGSRYLFIWMMFLGVSVSVRRGEVARVTVFLQVMPKIIQQISVYIYFIVSFIFFSYMLYTGIGVIHQQLMMNEMGTVIKIPMWLIGMCLPVCGLMGIINLIACFLYDLDSIARGDS